MAKWAGKLGFAVTHETEKNSGIWVSEIIERPCYGEVLTYKWNRQNNADKVNKDISLNNVFSVISDPYTTQHCYELAYVEYLGVKWQVTSITLAYPRLEITVGGVYNE